MNDNTTINHCIVARTGAGPVALVRKGGQLQLPTVLLPADYWLPDEAAGINGQLMEDHGLNCTLLRWLDASESSNLLVMEWHPGSPVPERGIDWVDPQRNDLPLAPEQRAMLTKWRESASDGLVPWEKPGWMREVVMWLIGLFDGARYPQLTNLAQIKSGWGMSTVLLMETTAADYYFKAGTRQGINEWRLTRLLHKQFPDIVPDPLLVDEERGWMITPAVQNTPLARLDLVGLGRAFRAYAKIQLGCGDWVQFGIAPGLRLRNASWLRRHLEIFCSDDDEQSVYREVRPERNAAQWASLKSRWLRHIEMLEASTFPMGLNQEDLHFENILNTVDGPVIIDWADCAVAHPLFSYHRILGLWGEDLSDDDALERMHVCAAYLESFIHLADDDQLRREVGMLRPLYPLYQAFRWQETALAQPRGSRWGERCRENVVRFLRAALEEAVTSF